ncbi:MAG: DoxX family protein [Rhodobacteraceae bacterium]|nr:DoxX family protein [Paracoccaceae bacterium]
MPLIALFNKVEDIFVRIQQTLSPWFIPSLARLLFVAILLIYYWNSALTKIGNGIAPSLGAYAQIFPKAMEKVGYDPGQLSIFHTLVVLAGTYAEFILPALILIGLLTRLAALGMIGFVLVQSFVDITGHGLDGRAIGTWFDRLPDSVIFDQRALWVFLLLLIALKGAGPISVDRFLLKSSD